MRRWIKGPAAEGLEGFGLRGARDAGDEARAALIEEAQAESASSLSLRYSPHDWRTIWGAAALGQLRILQNMLQKGEEVDRRDTEGKTPLIYATDFRQTSALCLLLEWGASPEVTDRTGKTAVFYVNEAGESLLTSLINAGANINHRDFQGYSALLYARANRRKRLSQLLRRFGAESTFLEAVMTGDVESTTDLPFSGDLNALLPNGETLLTHVVRQGSFSLTALLLERGADPNQADRTGQMPLEAAENRGRILRLLLDAGADPARLRESDSLVLLHRAGLVNGL